MKSCARCILVVVVKLPGSLKQWRQTKLPQMIVNMSINPSKPCMLALLIACIQTLTACMQTLTACMQTLIGAMHAEALCKHAGAHLNTSKFTGNLVACNQLFAVMQRFNVEIMKKITWI